MKVSRLPDRTLGALVFGVALAVRLLFLWSVWETPSVQYPLGDAEAYHEKALAILAGEWIGERPFYQDPLYPYFLAVLYAFFGESSVLVLCTQALLGAATALLLFWIGRGLYGPRRGLLVGLLAALYSVSLFYDALLLKVSLSLFLATLALLLTLRADQGDAEETPGRRRPLARWLGAGFAVGLATLTRGNYLLFIPLLIAWVWWGRRDGVRRTLPAVVLSAGIALAVLPVTLHNVAASGELIVITSQAGQNFYIGNFRGNDSGTYTAPPFVRAHPDHEEDDMRAEAERRVGRALAPGELSSFYFREGFAEIMAAPSHFLHHTLRKLWLLSNDYEVPDNYSFEYFRREYRTLLRLPLPSWGAVLPLALCGMAISLRDRRALLLTLYLAAYVASVVLFYTNSRYRMPLVPVVLVFAAGGAAQVVVWLRAQRWKTALPALAFLFVAWPLTFQDIVVDDLARYRNKLAVQHARRAQAARGAAVELSRRGDAGGARAVLKREAELSALAEREWMQAMEARPRSKRFQRAFFSHMALRIDALQDLGEDEQALKVAQTLGETFPDRPVAQALLGMALARVGRSEEARSALERALELEPGHALAREALARLRDPGATAPPDVGPTETGRSPRNGRPERGLR
jgi:4-amino-4-deoxy-L-arabinose transferase-like glycosyltransferase